MDNTTFEGFRAAQEHALDADPRATTDEPWPPMLRHMAPIPLPPALVRAAAAAPSSPPATTPAASACCSPRTAATTTTTTSAATPREEEGEGEGEEEEGDGEVSGEDAEEGCESPGKWLGEGGGAGGVKVVREADLLDGSFDIVLQCCNCLCHMGAGIAATIRKRYREAFLADLETPPEEEKKLGHYSSALVTVPSQPQKQFTIVNLYAQYDYGKDYRRLCYKALWLSLSRFLQQLRLQRCTYSVVIGTYWVGCVRAGGNKEVVHKILRSLFTDYSVTVVDSGPKRKTKRNSQQETPPSDEAATAFTPPVIHYPPSRTRPQTTTTTSVVCQYKSMRTMVDDCEDTIPVCIFLRAYQDFNHSIKICACCVSDSGLCCITGTPAAFEVTVFCCSELCISYTVVFQASKCLTAFLAVVSDFLLFSSPVNPRLTFKIFISNDTVDPPQEWFHQPPSCQGDPCLAFSKFFRCDPTDIGSGLSWSPLPTKFYLGVSQNTFTAAPHTCNIRVICWWQRIPILASSTLHRCVTKKLCKYSWKKYGISLSCNTTAASTRYTTVLHAVCTAPVAVDLWVAFHIGSPSSSACEAVRIANGLAHPGESQTDSQAPPVDVEIGHLSLLKGITGTLDMAVQSLLNNATPTSVSKILFSLIEQDPGTSSLITDVAKSLDSIITNSSPQFQATCVNILGVGSLPEIQPKLRELLEKSISAPKAPRKRPPPSASSKES
ncbi:hypothetical protein Pelo_13827 [Pelomyxa schiedti]|nr:hypothetical protein Pelo_13827 [Pelomyxa schiedti]